MSERTSNSELSFSRALTLSSKTERKNPVPVAIIHDSTMDFSSSSSLRRRKHILSRNMTQTAINRQYPWVAWISRAFILLSSINIDIDKRSICLVSLKPRAQGNNSHRTGSATCEPWLPDFMNMRYDNYETLGNRSLTRMLPSRQFTCDRDTYGIRMTHDDDANSLFTRACHFYGRATGCEISAREEFHRTR